MKQKVMLNQLLLDVRFSINWPFTSPSCLKPVNFEHCSHKVSLIRFRSCPAVRSPGISPIGITFFHLGVLCLRRISTKKRWLIRSWGAHMVTPPAVNKNKLSFTQKLILSFLSLSLSNLLLFIPSAVFLLGIIISPSFPKKPSPILHASAHLPA